MRRQSNKNYEVQRIDKRIDIGRGAQWKRSTYRLTLNGGQE